MATKCLDEISNNDILLDEYSCADRLALISDSSLNKDIYSDIMKNRMEYVLWYLSFSDTDFILYADKLLRTLYSIDPDLVDREYNEALSISEERFNILCMKDYAEFVGKMKKRIGDME